MPSNSTFTSLSVMVLKPFIYHVQLNRPAKMNAVDQTMWYELAKCFEELNENPDCRVVILSGAGKIFTAGLDFECSFALSDKLSEHEDVARKAKILMSTIKAYQNSVSSLERCNKPVLAAVHSSCIGAGVDFVTAADIRYCTKDAWFQVKEVVIGMAADVGTLQRLPKVIGSDSLARELCYTGRKMYADEAKECGLISKVFDDKESMMKYVLKTAEQIAAMSPVAVQVSKYNLVYSRDHSVQEGLNNIAIWNQSMLQSEDFLNAIAAVAAKQDDIVYSKL